MTIISSHVITKLSVILPTYLQFSQLHLGGFTIQPVSHNDILWYFYTHTNTIIIPLSISITFYTIKFTFTFTGYMLC